MAVDQLRLLNYSFSVYSRRQVRDLCDERRRHRGEVVTGRVCGGGGGAEDEEEEEGKFVRNPVADM